jgi:hypothetical protein
VETVPFFAQFRTLDGALIQYGVKSKPVIFKQFVNATRGFLVSARRELFSPLGVVSPVLPLCELPDCAGGVVVEPPPPLLPQAARENASTNARANVISFFILKTSV